MDPLALRVANRGLGNDEGAPALELTGPGTVIGFLSAGFVAIGGGDLGAQLDGAPVALWTAVRVRPGSVLAFERRRRGGRAVLAVAGGWHAPRHLGSASADLGGLGGQRLGRGARLHAPGADAAPPPALPASTLAALEALYAEAAADRPLRFVPEPDPDVTPAARALFAGTLYRVSPQSNRTGYRLAGPPLPTAPRADRLSEALAPGALQLPPDGAPILLMADRQPTGGYPRLGHLAAVDRPRAAQLLPGDPVRFGAVTRAEALDALRESAARGLRV
jgi:biotin-dependent carboxylase-like uncharacterized protein